jgi:anaerobic magnesium-protoporphyrin IX monomethyl ester cyclase
MAADVLLIQPPYKRAAEIPYGTIPALTAALRTNRISVQQRDLNVEFLLYLLDEKIAGLILEKLKEKRNIQRKRAKKKSLTERMKQKLLSNAFLRPHLQKLYILFVSPELKKKDKGLYRFSELENKITFFEKYHNRLSILKEDYLQQAKAGNIRVSTHRKLREYYKVATEALQLLAGLKKAGSHYFDYVKDESTNLYLQLYQDFIKSIDWESISLVGITVAKANKLEAFSLAYAIRKMYPEVPVVMGGELFRYLDLEDRYDQNDLQRMFNSFLDFVVLFEGETALVKLSQSLHKEDLSAIPNLIWKKDDKLVINRPFYMEKAEDIPPMDFDGLPVDMYPGFPIEISRGCYWSKCSFCRFHYFSTHMGDFQQGSRFYRAFTLEKTIQSIQQIKKKYSKSDFEFICLDISPPDMKKLCSAIIENKLDIRWGARLRLDQSFKTELFDLMARAGVFFFVFFPETFNQRTADLHHKNYRVDHIKSLLKYWESRSHELPMLVVKLFTAFPGERLKDFKETYRFAMGAKFGLQNIGRFGLSKHSEVYDNPEKYNVSIERFANPEAIFENYRMRWSEKTWKEKVKIERFLALRENSIKKHNSHWREKWKILFENDSINEE